MDCVKVLEHGMTVFIMVSQNFVKSEYDEKDPVYIILYGDDSVLCSSNLNKLQQLKENLNKKIEMKDRERLWKI